MARLRSLPVILAVVFTASLLASSMTGIVGADHSPYPPAVVGDYAADAETTCMTCHQTRGAISRIQQLTHEGRNLRPAWSPDGQKVAFYSNRTGNDDIWVASLDNGEEIQLTTDPASDRRPNWSPDGIWIAFDSDRSGDRDIWIIKADGSELKQLTSNPREELFASWSTDGRKIAFFSYGSGTNELWVIDVDGRNPGPLVPDLADEQAQQCSFACHQPAWDRSSQKLAFHSERSGNRDIWIVNADGTGLTRLTTDPDEDYFPSWTPDGRIVFMTERARPEKIWNDVRVINVDDGQETTLFTGVAHGGPLYWSPEGNRIALHSQRVGGNFNIFVATIGVASGAEPAVEVEQAVPKAQEPKAPEAEESGAEVTAPWRVGVRAVPALAVIVVLVGLGVIGVYRLRGGAR